MLRSEKAAVYPYHTEEARLPTPITEAGMISLL